MAAADPNYDWLSELPMPPGDPFLRMGTRSIDEADWLLVDHATSSELALRAELIEACLLYTSPSPRDQRGSRMPSSA